MKIIHMTAPENQQSFPLTYSEHLMLAARLEESNEFEEAIQVYQQCTSLNPNDEYAYERLMFLYHRQKNYTKELDVINRWIQTFAHLQDQNNLKQPVSKPLQVFGNFILKSAGFAKWTTPPQLQPQQGTKCHKWSALLKARFKD